MMDHTGRMQLAQDLCLRIADRYPGQDDWPASMVPLRQGRTPPGQTWRWPSLSPTRPGSRDTASSSAALPWGIGS